jgi:hypothetical protein
METAFQETKQLMKDDLQAEIDKHKARDEITKL